MESASWPLLAALLLSSSTATVAECLGCDYDLTSAYCWDLHLDALPDCLPDSLTYLDVYRSALGAVASTTFRRLPHLEILYLDDDQLQRLETGSLSALENLTQISMAVNGLTSVPEDVFAGNGQLRLINLSSNRLSSLQTPVFEGLPRLQQLYLNDNGLLRLEGDSLPASLRALDLSDNLLEALEPTLFSQTRDAVVALHGNPWLCDCRTTGILDSFLRNNVTMVQEPSCAAPPDLEGLLWSQTGDLCGGK